MTEHQPTCECGVSYEIGNPENEAWHLQVHEEFSLGPNIPQVQALPTIASKESLHLVVVDNSVAEPIRKAIAQVAVVAQRCMPAYPFGYYGGAKDGDRILYALVDGTRIVGMVITSFEEYLCRYTWTPDGDIHRNETNDTSVSGPKITRIWIAASYRRQGLAKWLIKEVGNHLDCEILNLGWEMPFTDFGKSLVKSVCTEVFLGCGDPQPS